MWRGEHHSWGGLSALTRDNMAGGFMISGQRWSLGWALMMHEKLIEILFMYGKRKRKLSTGLKGKEVEVIIRVRVIFDLALHHV